MKTYREVRNEMYEAALFKPEKKSRRKKKSAYMTDRDIKIEKLRKSKTLGGFDMKDDIRTPDRYFTSKEDMESSLLNLQDKLGILLGNWRR